MLNETRSNHYCDSGKYNGVPLSNSTFLRELPEFIHERIDKYIHQHAIIDLMKSILQHTNDKGPVLKNSIQLHDQEVPDHDVCDIEDEFMNNPDDSNDNMCECTT